jgi:hypothetical protein
MREKGPDRQGDGKRERVMAIEKERVASWEVLGNEERRILKGEIKNKNY